MELYTHTHMLCKLHPENLCTTHPGTWLHMAYALSRMACWQAMA